MFFPAKEAFLEADLSSQNGHEEGEKLACSSSLRKIGLTFISNKWTSADSLSMFNREFAVHLAKNDNVEVHVLSQSKEVNELAAGCHKVQPIAPLVRSGFDPLEYLVRPPKNHAVDFVIAHGVSLGREALHLKRCCCCKWIQVVHSSSALQADTIDCNKEKQFLEEMDLCTLADLVITVGPKVAKAYYLGKDENVFSLTPGIFTELADVKQPPQGKKIFSVLMFGTGSDEDFRLEGYDVAAKAIAMLDFCKLTIVGVPKGQEVKVAEMFLQQGSYCSQLVLQSFNEWEPVTAHFCEVDLALMPSRSEDFGLFALQALSAGLPVLVSGNSGLGEALKNVLHGSNYVVDSEDPYDWAKAIRNVQQKGRDLRLKESASIREAYALSYNWEKQCDLLVERLLHVHHNTVVTSLKEDGCTCGKLIKITWTGQECAAKRKIVKGEPFDPGESGTNALVTGSVKRACSESWRRSALLGPRIPFQTKFSPGILSDSHTRENQATAEQQIEETNAQVQYMKGEASIDAMVNQARSDEGSTKYELEGMEVMVNQARSDEGSTKYELEGMEVPDLDVVFALDYSSNVSDEELTKEINFAKQLAKSWNIHQQNSSDPVVLYGVYDNTVWFNPFDHQLSSVQLHELITNLKQPETECRRMDLALLEAARNFSASSSKSQVVVLITAGRQSSDAGSKDDKSNLFESAFQALSAMNVKVIVVSVGLDTDIKELGLLVKRPQALFRLSSFDDMTPDNVQRISSNIMKTSDIEDYAKKAVYGFSGTSQESSLWENASLCSDVVEGAWYLLYDDQRKPRRLENVNKLITENIDNFHSTIVSESKITISLAVVGPLGVGKSFFVNFLLNWHLPDAQKVGNGPLPSAVGASQTPIPIYVKYRKNVQVVLHKQESNGRPVVWFPEEELGSDTLSRVNSLLVTKFQAAASLKGAKCLELQGPFPVFHYLKERKNSSHFELDIDVQLVDMPGYGGETGNELINMELSNADVILFFNSGHSKRPVSSEDIAHIFRRLEELEFTSRPKLVHIVKDREPGCTSSHRFDLLCQESKEHLNKAWSTFLSITLDDEVRQGCYRDVRAKLPQLTGEALLEKLSKESDVIYFHSENSSIFDSLKKVISDHVQSVKVKQKLHPLLQNVHLVAKKLKTRIGNSLCDHEKKKKKPVEVKSGATDFEILPNMNEASKLITSFVEQTEVPLKSEFASVHHFLYSHFMFSSEMLNFVVNVLKDSLENYTIRLINAFMNANWSALQDVPTDLVELVEMLCNARVERFCANVAPAYLVHVLEKRKNRHQFGTSVKRRWLSSSSEERRVLCQELLHILLNDMEIALLQECRDSHNVRSHFKLIMELQEVVRELFAVRAFDVVCKTDLLKLLYQKLLMVIDFCKYATLEINPHPSLEVQQELPLPEKMVDAQESSRIPLPSDEKIVKEMAELLLNSHSKAADVIRRLETRLKLRHGELNLLQSQGLDMHLWALALVNVLSDKDHFDVELEPSLVLNWQDEEVAKLLSLARESLFAYQRSSISCKILKEQPLPENEIHLRKSFQGEKCLEALISTKMSENLKAIQGKFKDPSVHLAPIFIPTVRPGPTPDVKGNYFLQEDPWSKGKYPFEDVEYEISRVDEKKEQKIQPIGLNIFLVVEPQHLEAFKTTIGGLQYPKAEDINLVYVVLPQNGRGIGVTRAIVKSLAECLNFPLYWTIDDDIQFMYQFDGDDHRWHKCSITRGLLFGQRVFQTCLAKTVKALSDDDRVGFCDEVTSTSSWPSFARKTKRRAKLLLMDGKSFADVQKNPNLLHSPFQHISEDCEGDVAKEELMRACEREFVDNCRKCLFEDSVNHIAGVAIAHESTKRFDYMSKYPTADYIRSDHLLKVVLNNTCALKGRNFVTDEMIFLDEDHQVYDSKKRNTPSWGGRGSNKSFCRSLAVSGVIGYQVIRVIYSHKKLRTVFDRVVPLSAGSGKKSD